MFGGLFGRGSFLDEDVEGWCLRTWAWFLRNLGGLERLKATPLVTPSKDFFPPSDATGHARALHVFDCIRSVMGMADWDCVLEPYRRRDTNARVGEVVALRGRSAPNGTFQMAGGVVRIHYASDLVDKPADLVATHGP